MRVDCPNCGLDIEVYPEDQDVLICPDCATELPDPREKKYSSGIISVL